LTLDLISEKMPGCIHEACLFSLNFYDMVHHFVNCASLYACTVHNTHKRQFILCRHNIDNFCKTCISTWNHLL